MKTTQCQCGNRIFFENTLCHVCNSELGFLADEGKLSALHSLDEVRWESADNAKVYRKCQNYLEQTGCNWMIPDDESETLCLSCRLSEIIPDLSKPENILYWHRIEKAKRRLVYSLFWLDLPLINKQADPDKGLAFHLMEDYEHYSEFSTDPAQQTQVITGHLNGIITLNIAEADPVIREDVRVKMQERYRTLLGHLRHESGHYYWERLVDNSLLLDEFRQLFGDEREDYTQALQNYYNNGPKMNWADNWISAYASAHPWEDWAECWAHYLHMIDTMETANDFATEIYSVDPELSGKQFDKSLLDQIGIDRVIDNWSKLSVFLNEMNRSLGLADAYPFYLTEVVKQKMSFIHKVITGH